MKKLFILFLSVTFFACKKDRVCECTITSFNYYTGQPTSSGTTTTNYNKLNKQHANEVCPSYNFSSIVTGTTTIYTRTNCKLQ